MDRFHNFWVNLATGPKTVTLKTLRGAFEHYHDVNLHPGTIFCAISQAQNPDRPGYLHTVISYYLTESAMYDNMAPDDVHADYAVEYYRGIVDVTTGSIEWILIKNTPSDR